MARAGVLMQFPPWLRPGNRTACAFFNSLYDRYERALNALLDANDGVRHVGDAWWFVHRGYVRHPRQALERAIGLAPRHADACIALATFHAEAIDKVGPLIGRMTHGVRKGTGRALFWKALALNPGSAVALTEYASGLLKLEGEPRLWQASRLHR